jgi:DNA repair photolyase
VNAARPVGALPTVRSLEAKSMIVASKLPDTDCVVNPYVGCAFACSYCYASFMGRFVDEPVDAWGDYVYAKANAVEVVDAELSRMSAAKAQRSVLLSSVTDPYQGAEVQCLLTRGILDRFVAHAYPGKVCVLTKSNLVTRDIDLLTQLGDVEVGLTVTTTDDRVSRVLEVRAPTTSRRLRALARLHAARITTYAFVGPLLPHFADRIDLLDELFADIAATGVTEIYVEHLNVKRYILRRLQPVVATEPVDVRTAYESVRDADRRARLDAAVTDLLAAHHLTLRLGAVLEHAPLHLVPTPPTGDAPCPPLT